MKATLAVVSGLAITGLVMAHNSPSSIDILGPHPNAMPDPTGNTVSPPTQLCRQCHFDNPKEGNNMEGVTTPFQ